MPETTSTGYGYWVLIYLFFVSCIPFSTMVVGRYAGFAPAVWLYAANLILSALASLCMAFLAKREASGPTEQRIRADAVLIVSAVLSAAISFAAPSYATLAYLLNLAPPLARRWRRDR